MMNILPGHKPLISDVRQNGSGPLGRFSDAADMVRTGLSLVGAQSVSAAIRLAAALLAVRQGDLSVAEMHVQRAEELIPDLDEHPGLEAPTILAEYLLARRQPAQALALLSRTMQAQAIDAQGRGPTRC